MTYCDNFARLSGRFRGTKLTKKLPKATEVASRSVRPFVGRLTTFDEAFPTVKTVRADVRYTIGSDLNQHNTLLTEAGLTPSSIPFVS